MTLKQNGNQADLKTPLISACLIVKNEEDFLPGCLASIKDVADEIILVDTGSKDRTLEIAAEYGCRIIHFPWTGDFSAARNESLKHATGDWILIIDADEELPGDEIAAIREAVDNPANNILSLSVYNQSHETGRVSSFLPSIRLFRRRQGLSYRGIVHNRLILPPDMVVTRCDIKLYHYGYDLSRDRLKQKKTRSIELLEKQLAETPDDLFANFNMAQLLRGMGGLSDQNVCERIVMHARKVIDTAEQQSSADQGYRLMARIQGAAAFCTLGRFEEAEKLCREAMAIKPDYIDAVITLANVCLGNSQATLAKNYYRQYLSLIESYRPGNETDDLILHFLEAQHIAWYGLGVIAQADGDFDEASKCFRHVIDCDAAYLDTYYRLGFLYLKTNQARRAEEMFAKDLIIHPDSIPAYCGMAQALIVQGKPDQAVKHIEKAVEYDPGNSDLKFQLGKILLSLGQIEKGLGRIKEAAQIDPDDSNLNFECGNLMYQAGEIGEAIELYQASIAIQPGHNDALNNLGNCHFQLEEYEKACAIYEQLLDEAPEYWSGYRNLGLACARLGKNEKALNALAKYAEHKSGDNDIFNIIGDLCIALGDHGRAISCYEKYLVCHPQDTACLLKLAESYFRLGHHQAAELGYRKVLANDPECQLACRRLDAMAQSEVAG
jgi:tetratricopeptide (TPR) repeat protein